MVASSAAKTLEDANLLVLTKSATEKDCSWKMQIVVSSFSLSPLLKSLANACGNTRML